MDEEVHGFVKSALPPLSERVRNEVSYPSNGFKNVYPETKEEKDDKKDDKKDSKKVEKKAFGQRKHHHHHADISERNVDPFVYHYVNDNLPQFDEYHR